MASDISRSDKITINRDEYAHLLINSERLQRLEAGGVDNWIWYGDSLNPDGEESMDDFEKRIKNEVL